MSSSSFPTPSLVPEINGDVAKGGVTALSTLSFTISWPEIVTGFKGSDFILENAILDSFSGSGDTYSLEILPLADGQVRFTIPESSLSGISNNTNVQTDFLFMHNSSALSLAVTSASAPQTNQSSIPIQFLFSGDVSGFDAGDISVTNGSISGFTGSGSLYSATLSFLDEGLSTVMVADEAAVDVATGQRKTPPAALGISYDATNPTILISSPIANGATAGYLSVDFTFSFSETVNGFDVSDIETSNATLSGFSGNDDTYSVSVTPSSAGIVSLNIPADSGIDSAGNGNTASSSFIYTYDSSTVSVHFTSSESDPTNVRPVTIDIDFDLDMIGFVEGDLLVVGANLDDFSGSDAEYQVVLTPTGDGAVTLTVPAGVADSVSTMFPNVESSLTFSYDSGTPVSPVFNVRGLSSSTVVSANSTISELVQVELVTDYSGDTGSPLSFEYTTDGGSTWSAFVNNTPLTANGDYSGINIRVSDAAGNTASGAQLSNLTIDTEDPDSPVVSIDTDPVNNANEDFFGFSISFGEAGASYEYEILSDAGTSGDTGDDPVPLSGFGSLDGSGGDVVSNLSLSSLDDGIITIRVRISDTAGNQSGWAQDATDKDTVVPVAPSVVIQNSSPVTSLSNDSFSFDISGGEEGVEYTYVVYSTGGGAILSSTSSFVAGGTATQGPIDISAVKDGIITVSVTQKDGVGNMSLAGSDSVTLDSIAINNISLPDLVDNANKAAVPILLTAEIGSTYDYTLSSSNDGSASDASGSGNFDGSGEANLTLDLTGLNDGWLVMIVNVLDAVGNTSTEFGIVEKESVGPPSMAIADFSGETGNVTFDLSYHGYQTLPSDTVVRYDTSSVIGSNFDDTIKFSALEGGETFTVAGGSGSNTIDLSEHLGTEVTIHSGDIDDDTKANSGTITVDLGSGQSAIINYSDITRFVFNSNVFDGTPHGVEFTATDHEWSYNNKTIESYTSLGSRRTILVDYSGNLSTNFTLDLTVAMFDHGASDYENGSLVFDYISDTEYKAIEAGGGSDKWKLWRTKVKVGDFEEVLDVNLIADYPIITYEYPLQLRVTGVDGKTAELWSGGVKKTEYTFDDVLNDGRIGVSTVVAHSIMSLDMGPSDWAPYAKNYDRHFSHSGLTDITLDLLGDAVDAEGQYLTLVSVTPVNSRLTNNGNGTVTYNPPGTHYGEDLYTYVISDGVNQTTGTIRFDVTP